MRVIELRARNLMRISAVDIRPGKGITPIKGKNGSGKTSTLDALWIALKGKGVAPPQPIRKGQERATIQVQLGTDKVDLVVTRTFTRQEGSDYTSALDVRTGEGIKITKSPQAMLDALAGELGFDPLGFERAAPKDQFDMLRKLVPGVDFDSLARARQDAFDRRTVVNRHIQSEGARANGIQLPPGPEPKPIDVSGKLNELAEAGRINSEIRTARSECLRLAGEADSKEERAERLRAQAATLEHEAANHRQAIELMKPTTQREPIVEATLRAEIEQAEQVQRTIALFEQRRLHLANVEQFVAEARELTKAIEDIDESKTIAIATAKLPVEGLSLGDGEVTFDGLPFSQASAAVKMRVSVAVAMALNPELRMILVRDGSLLDQDSLKLLADMATEHGFDVLLETVDTSVPGGFEIVDGVAGEAKA